MDKCRHFSFVENSFGPESNFKILTGLQREPKKSAMVWTKKMVALSCLVISFLSCNASTALSTLTIKPAAYGGPSAAGNPFVFIAATKGYPIPSHSEFRMGPPGGDYAVALNKFYINQYLVSNEEFQRNFFDLNGDGVLGENGKGCSAYFTANCVGAAGLTAQDAWNLALDFDEDGNPDRTVIFDNVHGVTLQSAAANKDTNATLTYTHIRGPGAALAAPSVSYWNAGTATPWSIENSSYGSSSGTGVHPAFSLSWYEARAYCKFVHGRLADLPTDAEYERAMKGTTSLAYLYPWGNSQPDASRANCSDCGCTECNVKATPIGNFSAGRTQWNTSQPIELFDMVGNVWKWILDWNDILPYSSGWNNGIDPKKVEKTTSSARGIRGGSWHFDSSNLTTYTRSGYEPNTRFFGFRCVHH